MLVLMRTAAIPNLASAPCPTFGATPFMDEAVNGAVFPSAIPLVPGYRTVATFSRQFAIGFLQNVVGVGHGQEHLDALVEEGLCYGRSILILGRVLQLVEPIEAYSLDDAVGDAE